MLQAFAMPGKVLVTAALPYANGSVHLGHMLEFVQTDVYVRARRMAGDDVVWMWADDTHGTPIQLRARREGITPEELIARAYEEHRRDFEDFQLSFDIFHTTHSDEVRDHAGRIFEALRERGDVVEKEIEQLYCENDGMFLPDRFVRGGCPYCKSDDQYGDACEVCQRTYAPTDLAEPRCSVCGQPPVLRRSTHIFVPLEKHEAFLREWLKSPEDGGKTRLQPAVRNYVMGWVDGGLRDWDISRDGPYFGFEIPGYPGKYFYVWFDAPVGYVGATQKWCVQNGRDFGAYWRNPGGDTEIIHVIGKDIVYFHTLFWPAMLHAAGYTTPSRVQVHGWLTVNGEKMSKSRGTFILARTYLDHLPPDYLRYYFACKLSAVQDDFDLSLEDFANRVNADLVKKAANLASRAMKFIDARLGGTVAHIPADAETIATRAAERLAQAEDLYREFEFSRAIRLAMEIAEDFNLYISEKAPWKAVSEDPERARGVCSAGVYASQVVAAILKPVLPEYAAKVERFLQLPTALTFANGAERLPAGHRIATYEMLAERMDPKKLDAIIEASRETLGGAEPGGDGRIFDYAVPDLAAETKIDDFAAVDLRVGKITACEGEDGSKKLLRLTVDLGPLGVRKIFSGISASYDPAELIGRHVAVYANLKPRKMRFGVSEGMVLAAGASDDAITVLELDPRSKPGEKIT